jgi:hypothetical protein
MLKHSGARCVQCGKALRDNAEMVCLRPGDIEEWLCGKPKCEQDYNDNVPPKGKKRK